MSETVGDIDILVSSKTPKNVIEHFTHLGEVERVLAEGKTKGSIITKGQIQVDLRVVPPGSYGAALNYFTGSKEHNIRLREIAQQKKMKLNEYGLFRKSKSGTERRIAGRLESEVYEKLGLSYVPPEIREDSGEIEAAKTGTLPDLVSLEDIKGDLHFHSDWSDGVASLEELVRAGKGKGYSYLVVSDHSKSLHIAHGLNEKRLRSQMEEIDRLNSRTRGFRLLKGSEVDILPDGSLDLSDDALSMLDVVIVAVHSNFKMKRAKMTERVIRALENPHSHILAHPTGRLIGEREAYPIDMDSVISAAAETGTAIEINAHPSRLDLDSRMARRAAEAGVYVTIGTDTHNPLFEMDYMTYGVKGLAREIRHPQHEARQVSYLHPPQEAKALGIILPDKHLHQCRHNGSFVYAALTMWRVLAVPIFSKLTCLFAITRITYNITGGCVVNPALARCMRTMINRRWNRGFS